MTETPDHPTKGAPPAAAAEESDFSPFQQIMAFGKEKLIQVLEETGFTFRKENDAEFKLWDTDSIALGLGQGFLPSYAFNKMVERTRGYPEVDQQRALNDVAYCFFGAMQNIYKNHPKDFQFPPNFLSTHARNDAANGIEQYRDAAQAWLNHLDRELEQYMPAPEQSMAAKYAGRDPRPNGRG